MNFLILGEQQDTNRNAIHPQKEMENKRKIGGQANASGLPQNVQTTMRSFQPVLMQAPSPLNISIAPKTLHDRSSNGSKSKPF